MLGGLSKEATEEQAILFPRMSSTVERGVAALVLTDAPEMDHDMVLPMVAPSLEWWMREEETLEP